MKKSRVLTLGLACFFTAVTAFSTLAALGGGGAFYSHLNDTSHASSPLTQGGVHATQNSANNPQNGGENATTENLLIEPHEDDPIIYTTDYGLDIKWGNALPTTYGYSLGSGGMSGFPYFTTTKSGTTYTWVIIGRNSSITQTTTKFTQRFDYWKGDKSTLSTYYQNNHSTSPALTAINSSADTQAIVYDNVGLGRVKSSSELSSFANCVLCLSNNVIDSTPYLSSDLTYSWGTYMGAGCGSLSTTFTGTSNTLSNLHRTYYTSDKFGFGTYKTAIKSVTLKQQTEYSTDHWYDHTNKTITSCALYFFPLDATSYNEYNSGSTKTISGNNFCWNTYLTAAQWTTTQIVWARSMAMPGSALYINATGTTICYTGGSDVTFSRYTRPACVIQV